MPKYSIMHTEWSTGWGGQELRILGECRGMLGRGHRVILCLRPGARLAAPAEEAGTELRELAMKGPFDPGSIRGMRRLIRKERVDILNTHSSIDSWIGVFSAWRSPVALIRTRHTGGVNVHSCNLVYTRPQGFITTGQAIRRDLQEGYHIPEHRIVSLPTGVNTRRFHPGNPPPGLRAELGLAPGGPVVAMISVLRSWKRHDLFCAMAAKVHRQMPSARFLIVGEGPFRQKVEASVKEAGLGGSIIMTGHRDDVEDILRLGPICVNTSQGEEGVPQAITQALASECAVVSADQGSVPDVVIHQKTGLVTPFGDVDALARAVLEFLADPGKAAQMGRAGRELILQGYTMDQMIDATEEFYARILTGSKK